MSVIGNPIMLGRGGGGTRVASGEIVFASATNQVTIQHNLGSRKILCLMQRVNSDHSVVENAGRYVNTCLMLGTQELLWDTQQAYHVTGDANSYTEDIDSSEGYHFGMYTYMKAAAASSQYLGSSAQSNGTAKNRGCYAIDDNTIHLFTSYTFMVGRYVYRIYACED